DDGGEEGNIGEQGFHGIGGEIAIDRAAGLIFRSLFGALPPPKYGREHGRETLFLETLFRIRWLCGRLAEREGFEPSMGF
ncbi:MAG: hypothetical protein O7B81_01295, partial [Gammaproteobacteria bacterium]|nr:hypothetical protein [Gammaproteobacteria bacterium]